MASGGIMFSLWLAGEGTPPSPSSADLVSQLRELPAHMETSSCCYTLGAQGAEQPELRGGLVIRGLWPTGLQGRWGRRPSDFAEPGASVCWAEPRRPGAAGSGADRLPLALCLVASGVIV